MTTTSIPTGGALAFEIHGYTLEQAEEVEAKYYEIVDRLLAEVTGDESLSYYPATSEVIYECIGTGSRQREPLTPWHCDELDLQAICEQASREADEWGVRRFAHLEMALLGTIAHNNPSRDDRVQLLDNGNGNVWAKAADEDAYETAIAISDLTVAWSAQEWDLRLSARYYRAVHADTSDLMSALDHAGVLSEQDWDAGTTTWEFEDGSSITVDGPVVTVVTA